MRHMPAGQHLHTSACNDHAAAITQPAVVSRGAARIRSARARRPHAAGHWPGTRGDQFGVAASATRGSEAYRESQASSGTVTDQYEYNVELTWRLPINDRFLIQPDLQYFVHPGLARCVRNSVTVGLRIDLTFKG
jgi:hypothetical protein